MELLIEMSAVVVARGSCDGRVCWWEVAVLGVVGMVWASCSVCCAHEKMREESGQPP